MRGKYFIFIFSFLVTVFLTAGRAVANGNLVIRRHNNFISYINFHPGNSTQNLLILRSSLGSGIQFSDGSVITSIPILEDSDIAPELTMRPLFYPNPFRLEDGAILGYRLSRGDMDISIRMFDMRGNQIFRKDFQGGEPGAQIGYNKMPFNRSVLGHDNLPSGVYFYLILYNNKVIGKGKVAVKP